MANPHFEIKITKRSKRQSAVAGAAYQSGENLFSEYDQKHKDYRKKEGVVYTEIMLPSHAPPEYADREQLWNAVEAVENQWNSQLARRFVLALPREVPEELYPQMVQDYCNQFLFPRPQATGTQSPLSCDADHAGNGRTWKMASQSQKDL